VGTNPHRLFCACNRPSQGDRQDRTLILYFYQWITCSPFPGYLEACEVTSTRSRVIFTFRILFDYKCFTYFTIAFTAASPSTLTTTTPAGAAIVALSEVRTVLATV